MLMDGYTRNDIFVSDNAEDWISVASLISEEYGRQSIHNISPEKWGEMYRGNKYLVFHDDHLFQGGIQSHEHRTVHSCSELLDRGKPIDADGFAALL